MSDQAKVGMAAIIAVGLILITLLITSAFKGQVDPIAQRISRISTATVGEEAYVKLVQQALSNAKIDTVYVYKDTAELPIKVFGGK